MVPEVDCGDWLLLDKLSTSINTIRRGDVVMMRCDSMSFLLKHVLNTCLCLALSSHCFAKCPCKLHIEGCERCTSLTFLALVCLRHPSDPHRKTIGRVIAWSEDWIRLPHRPGFLGKVPPGHFWVETDNMSDDDSRALGPVSVVLVSTTLGLGFAFDSSQSFVLAVLRFSGCYRPH